MASKDMSVLKVQSNVRNALSLQQLDVVLGECVRVALLLARLIHN